MGLSTQALKPNSLGPDPRSGFNVVSGGLHTACTQLGLHRWTGFHALLRAAAACSLDLDRGRVEAKGSWDPDPRFASDLTPRSRVESPNVLGHRNTLAKFKTKTL